MSKSEEVLHTVNSHCWLLFSIWKAVSMNESMTPQERASLAVWDYPVSDKYTNMWRFMQANGLPNSSAEAINMVLNSESSDSGYAYIGFYLLKNLMNVICMFVSL